MVSVSEGKGVTNREEKVWRIRETRDKDIENENDSNKGRNKEGGKKELRGE